METLVNRFRNVAVRHSLRWHFTARSSTQREPQTTATLGMTDPPSGLAVALRRLPQRARAIEELAHRSESFFDLCEDLAEAERGLAIAELGPVEERDERRAEWKSWIEILTQEIEEALQRSKVVLMSRPGSPPLNAKRLR
jgi:hypothetical protein